MPSPSKEWHPSIQIRTFFPCSKQTNQEDLLYFLHYLDFTVKSQCSIFSDHWPIHSIHRTFTHLTSFQTTPNHPGCKSWAKAHRPLRWGSAKWCSISWRLLQWSKQLPAAWRVAVSAFLVALYGFQKIEPFFVVRLCLSDPFVLALNSQHISTGF